MVCLKEGYCPEKYWEERFSHGVSLKTVGYLGLSLNFNKWLYRVRRYVLLNVLSTLKIPLNNMSVLEIGPGSGFYVDIWKSLGVKKLAGIEITKTATTKLRESYPEYEFIQGDISRPELQKLINGSYNVVTCFDVLFHITNDSDFENALKNVAAALKRNGYLFITDLFPYNREFSGYHQKSRQLKCYLEFLNQQGIELIKKVPVFFLMHPPVKTKNKLLNYWWGGLMKGFGLFSFLGLQEIFGFCAGAVLYPVEVFFLKRIKQGPSTELIVCKKVR